MTYPDQLEIIPLTKPPFATVHVPGSKSITNRALVLAALAQNPDGCVLRNALQSEDTEIMVECLRVLGFHVHPGWAQSWISVSGGTPGDPIPAKSADLFVGNSGTTMRFLTALVSVGHGRYRLDGVPRMRERPIQDLLDALAKLGVKAYSENGNGCPPVIVEANGLHGGQVGIKGDTSSQFLSGLLMAAIRAKDSVTINLLGNIVSWPYVLMTVQLMKQFGAEVSPTRESGFMVPAPQSIRGNAYDIEPDASAASYFLAAAAIVRGCVSVPYSGWVEEGERPEPPPLLQGDWQFVDLLEQMGCQVKRADKSAIRHLQGLDRDTWQVTLAMTVEGRPLRGINIDMNAISDTVMTLAAVACFAKGPTTIRNVAHIRHKETDRIAALATELRKVGVYVEEYPDGLTITPRPLHGAVIDTYNDHRMAMSMALIGLKVPGIIIRNPGCVAKTYPNFFQDLEKLRV